jgi:antirestriction protein ArdC
MHVDETKKMVDAAIESLAEALDQGKSETLKAYLSAMGRFWRYSVGNAMLIALQRPGSTRVAGFHTWRKLGRSVRKGERGIAILAPIVCRRRSARETLVGESAIGVEREALDEERVVAGFRAAHVFDISQTNGKSLPEFACVQGEPGAMLDQLCRLIRCKGIFLDYTEDLDGARGVSIGGAIVIRDGLAPAEHFRTLAHELAHEMLHRDGVKRSKVVKETEADAVAYVVCAGIGLDPGNASCDYIKLYDGKKETLVASMDRIRNVAGEMLAAVSAKRTEDSQRAPIESSMPRRQVAA